MLVTYRAIAFKVVAIDKKISRGTEFGGIIPYFIPYFIVYLPL